MTDEDILTQFENQSLPFELWTHRMHVRVAYIYAKNYPYEEALEKLRIGIKAYNNKNGTKETATTGYNETTTVAFLRLIFATLNAYESIFTTSDSDHFCDTHPHLLSKTILRLYYSPEKRGLPETKTQFVAPDLSSLPKID